MIVTYIDHMGTDLTVVNTARVSFKKLHSIFHQDLDAKLIQYLAKHNHWSPFAHAIIQLHIKAPIFVARQLAKHQVGAAWNEVSRRYVDDEPEFYWPDKWRKKAENKKQGSSDEAILIEPMFLYSVHKNLVSYYNELLDDCCCPEQARMILPQNMYTEWYWTGSLYFFARVCNLRLEEHAQEETRQVARQISDIIQPLFPVSWKALIDKD